MTSFEIANKWQMNRYRTPGQLGGMDNREFYELMQEDISQYAKEIAIAFYKWVNKEGWCYYPGGYWKKWGDGEQTPTLLENELYEKFLTTLS